MADAQIRAVITADDQASKVVAGFGTKLGDVSVGTAALAAGLYKVGEAAINFGIDSVKAFTESQDAIAQTGAVLKSTGGQAGVTADEVTKLSTELQKNTRFSDEQVRSAENMLLTFTNIGKNVFPETTRAVADMATAMGSDLKSTSIQVGKALQDPINGVTALQRVGVRLTDSQKDMVKSLVESGHTMEAQKVILGELQKEFGGSAEAAGSTFAGSIEKLKNQFNDLQEKIGEFLAGSAMQFYNWLTVNNPIVEWFTNNMWALWTVIGALATLFVSIVIPAIVGLTVSLWAMAAAWIAAAWPILAIGAAIGLVAYMVVTNWELIKNAFGVAIAWIGERVDWFKNHWLEAIGFIIGFIATLPFKLPFYIAAAIQGMINLVTSVNWGGVFSTIGRGFFSIIDWIWGGITNMFDKMVHMNWGQIFANIGKGVANGMIGLIEGALNGALSGIPGSPKVNLPRFAGGVQNFGGGLAVVGERGAEVVRLPAGSDVIPNNQLGGMGSTINISINSMYSSGSEQEKRTFAKEILTALKDVANQKNTSVTELMGA